MSDSDPLDPATDMAFVVEIFLAEFAFEVSFFARDDDAIDKDETECSH